MHGRIFFQHDDKSKRAIVGHLTKHFETATNGDKAWKMADAPADFMLDMVQNIVGFQINIDTVQAKSKFDQNREMEDYDNVAHELEAKGLNRLASRMRYPKGDPPPISTDSHTTPNVRLGRAADDASVMAKISSSCARRHQIFAKGDQQNGNAGREDHPFHHQAAGM